MTVLLRCRCAKTCSLFVNRRNREIKRLLGTVQKDGLCTLSLSEVLLFAAPLVKHRPARMEIMRRYKVRSCRAKTTQITAAGCHEATHAGEAHAGGRRTAKSALI